MNKRQVLLDQLDNGASACLLHLKEVFPVFHENEDFRAWVKICYVSAIIESSNFMIGNDGMFSQYDMKNAGEEYIKNLARKGA